MAVMSDKQLEILQELERARERYEAFEEDLAKRIADIKWDKRAETRSLVREAREAGVPYRQIGFALKTSDHNTLKQYEQNIRR